MTTEPKKRVFISYNHNDSAYATRLALELGQDQAVEVFIDYWEMSAGDSLLDRLEKAIDESSFLIVLLSSNSLQSTWVRNELRYAYYREDELKRNFIFSLTETTVSNRDTDPCFT